MWATVISGLTMLYLNPVLLQSGGWMHAKLFFAALMIAYHVSLGVMRKRLENDPHYKSGKFFRVYNEVPTLLMIGIVIMVVVRPF
jgi:putative membrane protein